MVLAQGGRYLVVGCLNTAVGYLVFGAGLWLGLSHQVALMGNYLLGGLHSYLWNRFWTFRTAGSKRREVPRFVAVTLAVYAVNAGLLELFIRMGFLPLLAQVACLAITTVLGFLGHRAWSFRAEAPASRNGEPT